MNYVNDNNSRVFLRLYSWSNGYGGRSITNFKTFKMKDFFFTLGLGFAMGYICCLYLYIITRDENE
jgi:hypothetical protein